MDRAKFVAQELLSLSKGGSPIQKPTVLKGLLEDTARLAFTGSNLNWTLECPEDLWAVNIDSGQMNRAFLNILFNAQEASPTASTVRMVARNFEGIPPGLANGKYVVLDFIDQGIGIPPEVLPRIFDPYLYHKGDRFRPGHDRHLQHGKAPRRVHRGRIGGRERAPQVTIYIPAASADKVEPLPQQLKAVTGSGRILIMDDEDFILDVTGEVLQELGYEVDVAVGRARGIEESTRRP